MSEMLVSFSHGPANNTALVPKHMTWSEFVQRMKSPRVGDKDGSYLVRGGALRKPERGDENLEEAAVLVVDGDSGFDPETGEFFTATDPYTGKTKSSAPTIEEAAAAMDRLGYQYVLHTTHSYVPGVINKWRLYTPATMKNEDELGAAVDLIISQLHGAGCYVEANKESKVWSQAWFLPRCREELIGDFKSFSREEGGHLDVAAAVAVARGRAQAEAAVAKAQAPQTPRTTDGDSIIEAFNRVASLGWVRQTLEAQGYRFCGRKGDSYRYMAPQSESGTPGVNVFKGAEGDWCVYSHHGAHDPLSHTFCDPFRLFAIFNTGGDQKAAAKALAQEAGTGSPRDPLAGFEEEAVDFRKARQEAAQAAAGPTPADRFQWVTRATGASPVLNGNWLIKRVLPAEGLGVIYGRPGSGKTFSVMDIAMHISAGVTWRGQKTTQAGVSYVSPEAGRLGANRVIGWCRHHDIAWPDTFRLSPAQIDLNSADTDADALIADIKQNQPDCRLVVVDTLNRAMAGGDENSGEDMGNFVRLCDKIGKALNAFVLVVHHSGKDAAKGSRGHSSLLGAVSLELEVTREQGQPGVIKVTKMRDGEDGAEYGFTIGSVELGEDEDGEVVSTGISVSADASEVRETRQARPTGKNQVLVAQAFEQYADDYGQPNPAGCGFAEPGRVRVVEGDSFVAFAAGKIVGGKDHERRKAVKDAIDGLVGKRFFAVNRGFMWRIS
jgi:hypothetical protein